MQRDCGFRNGEHPAVRFAREGLNGAFDFDRVATSMRTGLTANAGAAASKERQNVSAKVAVCVLKSSATRSSLGASSLSRASHFPTMSFSKAVKPVTLPLGLARLGT